MASTEVAEHGVTVILRSPKDWHKWFGSIKTQAIAQRVWQYMDPDTPLDLVKPTKPPRPTTISETTRFNYTIDLEEYKEEKAVWVRADDNLGKMRRTICQTVASTHISDLAANVESPREILATLKKRLCPTEDTRENELLAQLDALQKAPKSQNFEKWTYEWREVVRDLMTMELIQLKAAKSLYYRMNLKFNAAIANQIWFWDKKLATKSSFEEFTNEFITAYREQGSLAKMQDSSFATTTGEPTFQGKQVESSNRTSKKLDSQTRKEKRGCLCGGDERWKECLYIVPSLRPRGWKPDPAKEKMVNEIVEKNYRVRKTVEAIRKKAASCSGALGPNNTNATSKISNLTADADDSDSEPCIFTTILPETLGLSAALSTPSNFALRDSWVIDGASHVHVCNMRDRFESIKPCHQVLLTGDNSTAIEGWGIAYAWIKKLDGRKKKMRMRAAYIPKFHTNLISTILLREGHGIFLDEFTMQLQRGPNRECFAQLDINHRMTVAEYNPLPEANRDAALATGSNFPSPPVAPPASNTKVGRPKTNVPKKAIGTKALWLSRLGNPNDEAIRRLSNIATDVEVTDLKEPNLQRGEPKALNEARELATANQQISRRQVVKDTDNIPFAEICWDLIVLKPIGYNGDKLVSHIYCRAIHLHVTETLRSKADAVESLITIVKRINCRFPQYKVRIIHTDVEPALGKRFQKFIRKKGISWEQSAPYVKEQNGRIERAGHYIVNRGRNLRIDANLPKELWPEVIKAATDLINLTPIASLAWQSPLGLLYKHLDLPPPPLMHLHAYGCRAYVRDPKVAKGDKMEDRAFIGYLIGYDSTNIFRVWIPHRDKVVRVRDVRFDETKRYGTDTEHLSIEQRQRIDDITDILALPEADSQLVYIESSISDLLREQLSEGAGDAGKITEPGLDRLTRQLLTPDPTPTPAATQSPDAFAPSPDVPTRDQQLQQLLDQIVDTNPNAEAYPNTSLDVEHSPPAIAVSARGGGSTTVSADIHEGHIVEGPRVRKPSARRAAYLAHLDGGLHEIENAFSNMNSAFSTATRPYKQHQSELPPPPESFKKMLSHPLSAEFEAAAKAEWTEVGKKGTYEKISRPKGVKVLPLRWVFTYKFDSDGYLIKCKARICVRGDLQDLTDLLNTRATTLAARVFRALMALVAAFDLETAQLDSINAFLNSVLDEVVYCEFPEGFEESGNCLLLKRALYGLRRSPLLWQKELSNTLRHLGLEPIPEEPCLFSNGRVIVFFYVDDIVLLARKEHREEMEGIKAKLSKKYEMRDLGELRWFLNIRIIRDRQQRKLWLCQDSYVDKIVKKFNLEHGVKAYTPLSLPRSEFVKYDGKATPQDLHAYQERIGSIIYPSIITRIDIAAAASLLATFMTNPSPRHRAEVDRLICYLRDTKHLAIEYSAGGPHQTSAKAVEAASDAAFGDDPASRRSSEGFVIRLFGGPIDWKATRQSSVSLSTTEAELMSLTNAARSYMWWTRFFRQIDFDPGHEPVIFCDNKMTTDHIMAENPKIHTNLKHVAIRDSWLRERAERKELAIEWVPTAEMPADGF
jgi:Reverse transcriptase (RNA-dependent DNA polymerase)